MIIFFFYFQHLNGVDLSNVARGVSLNTTARALVRAAYGETASFNDLAPGDFDILLGKINKKILVIILMFKISITRCCSSYAWNANHDRYYKQSLNKEFFATDET